MIVPRGTVFRVLRDRPDGAGVSAGDYVELLQDIDIESATSITARRLDVNAGRAGGPTWFISLHSVALMEDIPAPEPYVVIGGEDEDS
jgi:hypothetical protein